MRYDPQAAPDPSAWRQAEERARLRAIEDYHHRAALKMPNVRMHAVIHNVVENQLAEGLPETVATLERLARAGLTRHDALHAIGSVVAGQIHAMLSGAAQSLDEGAYARQLQALDPAAWRGSAEHPQPRAPARPTPEPATTQVPVRAPRRRR